MPEPFDQSPLEQHPSAPEVEIPWVTRVGTAVATGALSALVASLPALRRGAGPSWLALAAILAPFAIALVLVMRRARLGARLIPGATATLTGLLLWCTGLLGFGAVLGAVLRKHTHHHGLAGTTFAILMLGAGVGLALLVMRIMAVVQRGGRVARRAALAASGLALFAGVLLVGLVTAADEELRTSTALVDGLALAIACAIASSRAWAAQRLLALVGVPLAVGLVLLGASSYKDGGSPGALGERAPIHGALVSAFLGGAPTPH